MIQTEQLTQQQTLHARGICVIIPTYNNEGTIESVVRECCQQCNDVIVVNDGSTDRTGELLRQISDITLVEYTPNKGKGYALREGLEHFEKVLKHEIPVLRVSGGGSVSDDICQITADVFGKPVSRVQTKESSSLGAAIAGFMAIKEYKTIMVVPRSNFRIQNVAILETFFEMPL